MKIHSKYLGKDFEILEGDDKIRHESLENVIINEIGASYEFKVKEIDDHPVVICTISDNKGRKIQAIGEAKEDEEYPTIRASEMAFYKAAVMYLNISNMPSSEPIVYAEEPKENPIEVISAPIAMDEEKVEPEETVVAEIEEEIVEEPVVATEDPEDNKTNSVTETVSEPVLETNSEPHNDPIITIGTYKNKNMKASEIAAENLGWAEAIPKIMADVNGPLLEQVKALKYFSDIERQKSKK